MNKYLYICLFLTSNLCFGQNIDLGSWNILNIKYNIDDKWSLFSEAQLRSLKLYDQFHYYEFKGGLDYKVYKNLKFTLGGGSYQTFKEGANFLLPKNNNEIRIWPQVALLQSVGNIKIEQRYRSEFRFTSNGYRNRFRYRIGASYPFGKERHEYKPFLLSASNEIFFTDKEPYFERNRILLSFNYKFSKSSSILIGYLHQFDYKINDETGRDFFVIGYFIEFSRKSSPIANLEMDIKDN